MAISLRPVSPSDRDLICRHRRDMFLAAGDRDAAAAAMTPAYAAWQEQALRSGAYFGFIAELTGNPVAGIGLMVVDWPPHPCHPEDTRRGYVLNLFVEPEHRGRGIARELMAAAEADFKSRGVAHAVLTATDMARPIYEKDAWVQTAQMAKDLL